jgi:succinate-acetate transporter protein
MQRTPATSAEAQPAASPSTAGGSIADPAPLGLAAFGLTTLLAMSIQAGWLPIGTSIAVLGMAAAYGGTAQFVAGLWAFRRGNTFAATAFCSFGAFWWSYFLIVNTFAAQIHPASAVAGFLGLFTLAWGCFTAYMTVASLAGSKAVTLVFVLLTVTFWFLCAANWSGNAWVGHIAGYVGFATAIAALYASFADVTNASMRRTVLPTGAPFVS